MSDYADAMIALAEMLPEQSNDIRLRAIVLEVTDLRIRLAKAEKDRDRWRSGFRELIKCAVNHAKGMETTK
jgi:hypothetical protein